MGAAADEESSGGGDCDGTGVAVAVVKGRVVVTMGTSVVVAITSEVDVAGNAELICDVLITAMAVDTVMGTAVERITSDEVTIVGTMVATEVAMVVVKMY